MTGFSSSSMDKITGEIWKAYDELRGMSDLSEYRNYILTLLFLKYISDLWRDQYDQYKQQFGDDDKEILKHMARNSFILPGESDFYAIFEQRNNTDIGEIIDKALVKIEEANEKILGGIFYNISFTSERLGSTQQRNEFIKKQLEYLAALNLSLDPDHIGNTYPNLIGELFGAEGLQSGEYYTPRNLISLMIELIQPEAGMSLYDPTVGTGGMLVFANEWMKGKEVQEERLKLFGQDISPEAIFLARLNLFFHQLYDASIFLGDTLLHPYNVHEGELLQFDLILSNPPFGVRSQSRLQKLEEDPYHRFSFGIPSRSADFAFIQHIIASLKKEGKAIVIVPNSVLFISGDDGEIRKKIVENDLIEAVVSLGPALLPDTSAPINLLVINKSKPKSKKGKILVINAISEYEHSARASNIININQQNKIVETFRSYKQVKSFSAIIDHGHLKQNDFILLPARYVDLLNINTFLGGKVTSVKFSQIAKILQGTPRFRNSRSERKIRVIRIPDLANPSIKVDDLQKISPPEDKRNIEYTKSGDILISRTGAGSFKILLVKDNLNGVMVDQNLYIIRLLPEYHKLRRYVVDFLRSDKGQGLFSQYMVGAAIPQLRFSDLIKMEIPIPNEMVINLLTDIHQVEQELLIRMEKARDLRTQLFSIDDASAFQHRLDELSTDAHVLSSSLVQSESLDYQVRNFYPYPLSFSYSMIRGLHDPIRRYSEQLRLAENLLAFLANIGISLAQVNETLMSEENTNITSKSLLDMFGGGVSPGDWQSIAQSTARLIRGKRAYALAESFSSIWFKGAGRKESVFGRDIKRLVQLKNDYKHDRGPKTPHDFSQASSQLQELIDYCYKQVSFFVKYPIRLVESLDVDWQTQEAIMDTLVSAGDNPGLRREKIRYPQPLPIGLLYLELQKNKWISLYPNISVQYCRSCKVRETYFIDRLDGVGGKVVLKSFERGHTHESDTEAKNVATDMTHWIKNNLKP